MKRVAVFTQGGVTYPKSVGHVPALENLFTRLSETTDITIYTTSPHPGTAGTYACGNATVRQLDVRYNDPILRKLTAFIAAFFEDHRRDPFDVLHGFWVLPGGFIAATLGILTRLPNVVSIWGGESAAVHAIGYGNMLKRISRLATLWTCERARVLTALTSFQQEGLNEHGLRRKNVRIIPCGVDRSIFFAAHSKPEVPPFNLLHIGNLTEVKDQETLLKAFAIMRGEIDARLRIIGPDYLNGKIQNLARVLNLSDKIEFLGLIDNNRIPELCRWAHLMIHSSLSEGQPIVVSEAAACGTVTCGTRVGLIADLENKCTVAVDVGDYQELARRSLDLLRHPDRLKQLEENAVTWAHEHDLDWTAEQFEQIYDEVIFS